MNIDLRLVAKGEGEPRVGLVQQGRAHVALAKHYAAALVESGWSDEDTAALEREVATLESAAAAQAEELAAGDPGESKAVAEAKAFLRRLRLALPRALRESKVGVSPKVFETTNGGPGRSGPRLSAHLARIRPAVEAMDGDLARYFGGRRASRVLDAVKRGLDQGRAGGAPEDELLSLPGEILAIYEVKGRLLERIEDLNRAGRIAFEGQAETVGKFNKDILLRARRERSQAILGSPTYA
jgi:hypothetical protein